VGLPGAAITGVEGEAFHLRAAFASYSIQVLAAPGFMLQGAVAAPAEETAPTPDLPTRLPVFSDLTKHSEEVLSNRALQVFGPSQGEADKTPTALVQDLMFSLPDGVTLLGVDLHSGRSGVLYDELGLNGASLLDLEKWNPQLRRALLAHAKPDLIVLAYGTNDEGLGSEAVLDYQARMRTLLRNLKGEAKAPILVIGPLDRFGNRRRARPVLKAGAARVIADMKQACLAEGCAFWDARAAMGGYGSIRQWSRTGLAQRDLVHLTGRGYEGLGDLFCDQLLERYERRDQPSAPLAPPNGRKKGK
jgi:lysophospholipase L1-like esterase